MVRAAGLLPFVLLACAPRVGTSSGPTDDAGRSGAQPSPPADGDAGASEVGSIAADGSASPSPLSRTFVLATLGASKDASGNNLCSVANAATQVLSIGTPTGQFPVRVRDGETQGGSGIVNVSCSVTGGFDVSLQAYLGGAPGGSLAISGHVDAVSGGQVIGGILRTASGAFSQADCTVAFTYGGGAVPTATPVAPGRIWAHLSCPKMANQDGHVVQLSNGTIVAEVCDGEVDFLFENCAL